MEEREIKSKGGSVEEKGKGKVGNDSESEGERGGEEK